MNIEDFPPRLSRTWLPASRTQLIAGRAFDVADVRRHVLDGSLFGWLADHST